MSKRLIMILALAFVLGICVAAYAEVQNVKVSGDFTAAGVARNDFDLTKTPSGQPAGPFGALWANYDDNEKDLFSITRVRVDADLTDNVTATVRLLNERNWNGESSTDSSSTYPSSSSESNRNIGLSTTSTYNTEGVEDRVSIDLAYVTLKEFLYSPLTVAVGRQELHFGNDFILGDPDTNGYALRSALAEGDLSARKAFDAVRVTLDYNPLVVDGIFAKVAENNTVKNDDKTLFGANASYAVDKNTTVEAYYFGKIKGSQNLAVTNVDSGLATSFDGLTGRADTVHTLGARVVNKTLKNLSLDVQAAYQFGRYNPRFDPNAKYASITDRRDTAHRSAWAGEFIAAYDLKDITMIGKYSPNIAATYAFASGEKRGRVGDGKYRGWDPMFENQTIGHIINAIKSFTNNHVAGLTLKAKPLEDITAKFDFVSLWTATKNPNNTKIDLSGVDGARQYLTGNSNLLGLEYDLTVTYDYTEDVQFSLLYGAFAAHKGFDGAIDYQSARDRENMGATATEVIGSMKVTF